MCLKPLNGIINSYQSHAKPHTSKLIMQNINYVITQTYDGEFSDACTGYNIYRKLAARAFVINAIQRVSSSEGRIA